MLWFYHFYTTEDRLTVITVGDRIRSQYKQRLRNCKWRNFFVIQPITGQELHD